jgi:hypothetical protein
MEAGQGSGNDGAGKGRRCIKNDPRNTDTKPNQTPMNHGLRFLPVSWGSCPALSFIETGWF